PGGAVSDVQRSGQRVLGAAVRPSPRSGLAWWGPRARGASRHRHRTRTALATGPVERGDHTTGGGTVTVRLVTDSASDLPQEWVDEFGITVVHLHVVEEGDRTVSTAAVTPDQLATIYEELLSDPECTGVVSVHLSRQLSRTWESAAD